MVFMGAVCGIKLHHSTGAGGREPEPGQSSGHAGGPVEDGLHCLQQEDTGSQRTAQSHRDENEGAVETS